MQHIEVLEKFAAVRELVQDEQYEEAAQAMRDLRDGQEVIPCEEGECICNDFDLVIDRLDEPMRYDDTENEFEALLLLFQGEARDEIRRFYQMILDEPDMEQATREGYELQIQKIEEALKNCQTQEVPA